MQVLYFDMDTCDTSSRQVDPATLEQAREVARDIFTKVPTANLAQVVDAKGFVLQHFTPKTVG